MRTTLVTTQLHPFHEGPWALHAAALCEALATSGHELVVVAPFPAGCDANRHALARRLQPFELVRGSQTIPVIRYEGRLACGAKLTLLGREQPEKGELARWFPAAAAQWIHAEADDAGWHLAAGPDCAPAAAWLLAGGLEKVGMIVDPSLDPGIPSSRDAMTRVRWIAVATEDGLLPEDTTALGVVGDVALASRVHAFAMPPSLGGPRHNPQGRELNKASVQLKLGLPVAATVPLVLFDTASSELAMDTLRNALRHGLQAVCADPRRSPDLAQLCQTYPDRLVCLSEEPLSRGALLGAVDASMTFDDLDKAYEAAAHGAIPVVTASSAGIFIDISPDLESGSAVLATEATADSLDGALARVAGLATQPHRLAALQRRLPGYVPTWSKTAALLAELMAN